MHSTIQAREFGAADPTEFARRVADEIPVALTYHGLPHAVLMATPADFHDLAVGFSLTDGICAPSEIVGIEVHAAPDAVDIDIRLAAPAFRRFLHHRQQRTSRSHTSCGLCGVATRDQIPSAAPLGRPLQQVPQSALRRAMTDLMPLQHLHRQTGAAHAAAWVDRTGRIVLVREDVGRHNALDKLIGARAALREAAGEGFCLITSRCSYEMVQKATVAGMGMLVAISAPTSLAIRAAEQSGLVLVALARADSQTIYAGADLLRAA